MAARSVSSAAGDSTSQITLVAGGERRTRRVASRRCIAKTALRLAALAVRETASFLSPMRPSTSNVEESSSPGSRGGGGRNPLAVSRGEKRRCKSRAAQTLSAAWERWLVSWTGTVGGLVRGGGGGQWVGLPSTHTHTRAHSETDMRTHARSTRPPRRSHTSLPGSAARLSTSSIWVVEISEGAALNNEISRPDEDEMRWE
ncbi:hypothetical protein PR048_029493 [Dryococelus australis]|uniref:Uncharacterized protein n=1 Tax=Dryococelus australis TaxID=614101 RepID=A0ABQ9GDL4_9NEOP|nr:hypothetical protein PR048_029493 [Dryococelus australis]